MKTQHQPLHAQIARVPCSVPDSAIAGVVQGKIALRFTHWIPPGFALLLAFALIIGVTSLLSLSAHAQVAPMQPEASNYPNWWQ